MVTTCNTQSNFPQVNTTAPNAVTPGTINSRHDVTLPRAILSYKHQTTRLWIGYVSATAALLEPLAYYTDHAQW